MADTLTQTIEKGTLWTSGATFITKFVALLNVFLVISHLSVYAYGVSELALSVVGLMSIFTLPGIDRTALTDIAVEKGRGNMGRAQRIFFDFFILQFILGCIASAILFFGASFVAKLFTVEISGYFKIIALLFLLSPLGANLRALFNLYFDFKSMSVLTFLQEAVKLAVLLLLITFSTLSIAGLLWSLVIAQVGSMLLLAPRYMRWHKQFTKEPVEGKPAPLALVLQHGKWTVLASYVDTLGKNVRVWLIKLFLGTEAVALFAVAQGAVGHLMSLLQISTVVAPILPQYLDDKPRFYRIIDKTCKYQFFIAIAAIAGSALTAYPFLSLFFPQYLPSLPIFYVLMFSLIPASAVTVLQTLFYILKAQRNLFFSMFIKFALVAALTPVCIMLFGLPGTGLEFVLTSVFFGLERYRVLHKRLSGFSIKLSDFVTFDEYDKMLLQRVWNKFTRYLPVH